MHPCVKAHQLRDKLGIVIDQANWEQAQSYTLELSELLSTLPQLEGICKVGWQTYFYAPKEARSSIEQLNELIDQQRILWHKNKKKAEKANKKRKKKT